MAARRATHGRRARLRHANRIYEALRRGVTATPRELMRIEAQDIA